MIIWHVCGHQDTCGLEELNDGHVMMCVLKVYNSVIFTGSFAVKTEITIEEC